MSKKKRVVDSDEWLGLVMQLGLGIIFLASVVVMAIEMIKVAI